jgi:hypothetical protein
MDRNLKHPLFSLQFKGTKLVHDAYTFDVDKQIGEGTYGERACHAMQKLSLMPCSEQAKSSLGTAKRQGTKSLSRRSSWTWRRTGFPSPQSEKSKS